MSRDKQFEGFAKSLTDELIKHLTSRGGLTLDEIEQEWRKIIARRAYDLSFHSVDNSRANDMEDWETERIMPYVPDMAELPDEYVMSKVEAFKKLSSPGVTFSDKQKEAIRERQNLSGSQFDQEYLGKFVE